MLDLTKKEAHAVAEFIDMNFIQSIRNDLDIDSMEWVKSMIHAYEKLCEHGEYRGYSEPGVF